VPNYFGPQRFGNHQDNHLLGKAVVQNNAAAFADLFLGHPREDIDSSTVFEARRLYDEGRYDEAAKAWPGSFFDQRRALRALAAGKGNKKKVFYIVDKHLKSLFISAYQSDLFNRVLSARMPDIDKLLLGDMAYKHDNGACFRVDKPDVEQPRCDNFEISPTGPLLGERTTRLTGPAGEIENPILDGENLSDLDTRQMKHFGSRGGRRPLRFQPRNAAVTSGEDDLGPYLELAFELDSGCYATALLAELSKDRVAETGEAAEPEE
jgi:tRNA pseudouridine13 synthase